MLNALTRIAIVLTALLSIDSVRFADPDLFVTLYSGREIAAHGGPPRVDAASFTVAGQPWNDYEWLARLAAYRIGSRAGDRGLVVTRLVIIAALLGTIVAVSIAAGGGVASLAAAVALFVGAAGGYFLFRPTLVTFLAVALLLAAIERMRLGARWPLWAIPAAIPLWTNLHAGFALGVVLLGLLAAVGLAELWISPLRSAFAPGVRWSRSVPCFVASAALTGVHPLGYGAWRAVFGTLAGTFTPSLSEWRPLIEFGFWEIWPAYLLMVVLGIAIAAGYRRLAAFDVAAALILLAASFVRVRFLPLFTLCATLLLLRALPALADLAPVHRFIDELPTGRAKLARAGAAIAAIAALAWIARTGATDLRIRKIPYLTPVSAVKFLQANGMTGRILTEYDWGGYVRWKIPDASIFVDGRSDTVYPLPVIEDWARFVNALPGWTEVPVRYDAQIVVLRRDQPVVAELERDPGWIAAYADGFASVFLRAIPDNAAAIDALREGRAVVPVVGREDYLGL